MDLNVKLTIISIIVTIIITTIFGIPNYVSAYYAKKDHDKENQVSVIQESQIDEHFNKEDIVRAKDLVNKALLGMITDWNSHLKTPREFNNPDGEYSEFARHGNIKYHLDQFIHVSTK